MNLEKFGSAAYWPALENTKFLSLNWTIWESILEQHSNIMSSNLFVNGHKIKNFRRPVLRNPNFESMDKLEKGEFT